MDTEHEDAGLREPSAKFRNERSRYGKGLSELKSALQKYVRRGEPAKALWCAGELLSFRGAPEVKDRARIRTNVRHRLMVILLEDVGDIGLWEGASAAFAAGTDTSRAVHEWVWRLATATKARVCSHARAVASLRAPAAGEALAMARRLYLPIAVLYAEYAADPRSAQAEEPAWRGALSEALAARSPTAIFWAHAIQEDGAPRTCEGGRKPVWQVFEALQAVADVRIARLIPMARQWYKDLHPKTEAFLCWMLPLLAHVDRHPFDRNVERPYRVPEGPPFAPAGDLRLDSYVFDIHTTGDRKQGGLTRFAEEGSLVLQEDAVVRLTWRNFYEDRKRLADSVDPVGPQTPGAGGVIAALPPAVALAAPPSAVALAALPPAVALAAPPPAVALAAPPPAVALAAPARETEYILLARAQITTSNGKTDVYFAWSPEGKAVVVKGPFASRAPVDRALAIAKWKRVRGLPTTDASAVRLLPDRWPSGVPLGLRNRVLEDSPAWFLVADSLVTSPLEVCVHAATKVWPPTAVIDWEALSSHTWRPLTHWDTYSHRERLDYVLGLLARYVVGIGDQADRNFFRAGGRVYSLDEDGGFSETRPGKELRKNKAALVRGYLGEHWSEIREAVAGWAAPAVAHPACPERLRYISAKDNACALFVE